MCIALAVFFVASLACADPIGQTDQMVEFIATPILDNILEGMKSHDYRKVSADFDVSMKSFPEKEFYRISDLFGYYKEKQYLGFYIKSKMTIVLWKARFDKMEDDVLVTLVVSKEADKYVVTGLWFSPDPRCYNWASGQYIII